MENIKKLKAWVYGLPVGEIESLENGSFRFTYYKGVPKGYEVSLAIPVRKDAYIFKTFPAALGQHIPQGVVRYTIESAFAKVVGFKGLTDMDFLKIIGRNQCGRVSFTEISTTKLIKPAPFHIDRQKIESSNNGEALFHTYMMKPRNIGEYCGVAGAVPKLLGETVEESVNIAAHSSRTLMYDDSILKSSNPMIPSLCVNEFTCLSAAKHAGFNTPATTQSRDGSLMLIKRFDRRGAAKLGFEDFSAMAAYKDSDLENAQYNGTYKNVLDAALFYCKQRGLSLAGCQGIQLALLKRMAFSNFMRDNDLHLKNMGLIYSSKNIAVSPLYDVTCTDILNVHGVMMHSRMALSWEIKNGDTSWKSPDDMIAFGKKHTSIPDKSIEEAIAGVYTSIKQWAAKQIESPENDVQIAISTCVQKTFNLYEAMGGATLVEHDNDADSAHEFNL